MKPNPHKSVLIIMLSMGIICTPVYQSFAVLPSPSYVKKIDPRKHKTAWITAALATVAVVLAIGGITYGVESQQKKEAKKAMLASTVNQNGTSGTTSSFKQEKPDLEPAAPPQIIAQPGEQEEEPLLPAPIRQEALYENPRTEAATHVPRHVQEKLSSHFINPFSIDDIFPAIAEGNYTRVKLILDHGGKVNYVSAQYRFTPLTLAAEKNNLPLVKYLLRRNAEPALEDLNGKTALKYAIENNNKEMVQLLLYNDPNPVAINQSLNSVGSDDQTPLMVAAYYEHPDMVDYLIAHGADPKKKNNNKKTAYDFLMLPNKRLKKYPTADRSLETYNRMSISHSLTGRTLLPFK